MDKIIERDKVSYQLMLDRENDIKYLLRVIKSYKDLVMSYRLGISPKDKSLDELHAFNNIYYKKDFIRYE